MRACITMAGYYRTASNDLYQGQAVAEFAYGVLGLRRMATIDDGDPYTTGFTGAFAAAFEALGGAGGCGGGDQPGGQRYDAGA